MPTKTAPDIFISYSHKEDPQWMAKFRELLEREVNRRASRDVSFWQDLELRAGEEWNSEILRAVSSASILVAVVSPRWLTSQFCQQELANFKGIAVVTAMTLDVRSQLPDALRRYQWKDFFSVDPSGVDRTFPPRDDGEFRQAIEYLAASIARLLALPPRRILDEALAKARTFAEPILRERCGTMRILDMERPIDAETIYTRVNILERLTGRRRKSMAEIQAELNSHDSSRFGMAQPAEIKLDAESVAANHRRLFVLGKPGAGKTTFLKRLSIRCAEGRFSGDLAPAYVELRSLANSTLEDQFRRLWGQDPWPLIEAGRALVLLDGLDEVPEAQFKAVRSQVESLAERAGSSVILLSCRIAAQDYVFPQFTDVEIADFGHEEISAFSRLWFTARGLPEKWEPFVQRLVDHPPLLELAHSPLLLTMMTLLFEERSDFDGNRAELYEEAISILLKKWDAKRSIVRDKPYESLTLTRRQDLLCSIARARFERNEYLFERVGLEQQVLHYFHQYGLALDLQPEAIVTAIEAQHGLLVERARGIYSFSHLTFQEYFTARSFVADIGDRWEKLLPHVIEPRWKEVFALVVCMVEPHEILLRMQHTLAARTKSSNAIQLLLSWLKRMGLSPTSDHRAAARRALYLNIARLCFSDVCEDPDASGEETLEDKQLLELAIELDDDMNDHLCESCELDLDLAKVFFYSNRRKKYSDGWHSAPAYREMSLNLAHAISLSSKLGVASRSVQRLQDLWEQVDRQQVNRAWRITFRDLIRESRDIGHDFSLTAVDCSLLQETYVGSRLIAACAKTSRVKTLTRTRVEETMLCPFADVEALLNPFMSR